MGDTFRVVKLSAGMTMEFEIIRTNAPDSVIMANMTYVSVCQEDMENMENPYAVIESMGYEVELVGDQDTLDSDEVIADKEFNYYEY